MCGRGGGPTKILLFPWYACSLCLVVVVVGVVSCARHGALAVAVLVFLRLDAYVGVWVLSCMVVSIMT